MKFDDVQLGIALTIATLLGSGISFVKIIRLLSSEYGKISMQLYPQYLVQEWKQLFELAIWSRNWNNYFSWIIGAEIWNICLSWIFGTSL